MVKIVLCDDHKIVHMGLAHILKGYPEFQLLDTVSRGELLFKKLNENKPDVLILDIALPGRNGLDILLQVKSLYPDMHVIIHSMYPEEQYAIRMMKAGADGYIHKDNDPEELINAIKSVTKGKKYFGEKISKLLFNEVVADKGKLPHELLSDREFEVLLHIGQGKSISSIGEMLSLSVKTISTYRARILEKMDMKNNAELIIYMQAHNLLPI